MNADRCHINSPALTPVVRGCFSLIQVRLRVAALAPLPEALRRVPHHPPQDGARQREEPAGDRRNDRGEAGALHADVTTFVMM